jgi:hypothetical protein
MERKSINASPTAKLLGVVFDQEMRWKQHVQQVVKRATKPSIAMGGLRHLCPVQMRQLYQACVPQSSTMHQRSGITPLKIRPTS